jgi:hypothetical protein
LDPSQSTTAAKLYLPSMSLDLKRVREFASERIRISGPMNNMSMHNESMWLIRSGVRCSLEPLPLKSMLLSLAVTGSEKEREFGSEKKHNNHPMKS